MSDTSYYQRGFGLKQAISPTLRRDYHSALVSRLREQGSRLEAGELSIRLAQEFGFCYGVDRAVEYAYETVEKFPQRRIFLIGEIIHNPRVNDRLQGMGIRFLAGHEELSDLATEDVVIIPAFGVPVPLFHALRKTGCVLVDTTCGSVLNVWKNVERYAREGFTSVIHGKYEHEETRATASRALMHAGGHYIIVKDMRQAGQVAAYIEAKDGPARATFMQAFGKASSPGFDPDLHLERIGVANQTTMLSSESLAIAERLRQALTSRHGEAQIEKQFRSFDTICSATQDRQDAVMSMVKEGVDLLLIIGGYNSSNTNHLTSMGEASVPTFHINAADCIQGPDAIRHQPFGSTTETHTTSWLPAGPLRVGITAGASTPNVMIGEVIEALLRARGLDPDNVFSSQPG
ncbi:MAG: 4-hydroxy-3-methylbut-2-enyl diphosphate reductase [Candidatus Polarisedimenticolia bacterium]